MIVDPWNFEPNSKPDVVAVPVINGWSPPMIDDAFGYGNRRLATQEDIDSLQRQVTAFHLIIEPALRIAKAVESFKANKGDAT